MLTPHGTNMHTSSSPQRKPQSPGLQDINLKVPQIFCLNGSTENHIAYPGDLGKDTNIAKPRELEKATGFQGIQDSVVR